MTDIISIILLGIVEGVTEFLPVSSTGHLILATKLLGYDAEKWAVFNIVIQLGSILAIVVLYWRTFWAVGLGLLRRDPVSIRFVRNLLVAFVPAAVIGLAIHKQIEALLGNAEIVSIALIVGGFAIIAVERFAPKSDIVGVADIPLGKVVGIGFLPGAPITADQWKMLARDNVVSGEDGLKTFGIVPTPLDSVASGWLVRYRKGGRFAAPTAA